MLRNASLFFAVSLIIQFASGLEPTCRDEPSTKKLLHNIDKLLNQNNVKIIDGITLKRKLDKRRNGEEITDSTCRNTTSDLIHELQTRIDEIMKSHVLEFDLASVIKKDIASGETGRRRHRQQQAISMMLMGITVFLMVFVPMGFQFLAALGGKAFLMAKLALLLASVNGLKRVANSGVHYGLYHTTPELGGPGYPPLYGYERHDRPRSTLK